MFKRIIGPFLKNWVVGLLFWVVDKSRDSGYSEISSPLWPLHLPMWPWESHLNSLELNFLLCKKEIDN